MANLGKRKRILFMAHRGTLGGGERSLLELISALSCHNKYELFFLGFEQGQLPLKLSKFGVKVKIIPFPQTALNAHRQEVIRPWFILKVMINIICPFFRALRFIRNHKIDIVHSNGFKACFLGLFAAKICRCKIVWHVRDVWMEKTTGYLLIGLGRFVDRIVAISESVQNALPTNWKNVILIYNGIEREYLLNYEGGESLLVSKEKGNFIVGTIGAFTPIKAQDSLLLAAQQVISKRPNIKFIVVGDVMSNTSRDLEFKKNLFEMTYSLGISDSVIFTGYQDDIRGILKDMDVVVQPSTYPESFGRTLVEAMCMKKPVIATNIGGFAEIVKDGVTGFLVSPNNPNAISNKILELERNRHRAVKMGKRGYERSKLFGIERVVDEMKNLYAQLEY